MPNSYNAAGLSMARNSIDEKLFASGERHRLRKMIPLWLGRTPPSCPSPIEGEGVEFDVSVDDDLAVPVQDADINGPRVEIGSTVVEVLFCLKSRLSSSPLRCFG